MKFKMRDYLIGFILFLGGISVLVFPPQKMNSTKKIHLDALIPVTIADWKSHTYDTKNYDDQWKSINELLVRTYYKLESNKAVDLYVEYSGDMRRAFGFHFPENCYRGGGNSFVVLDDFKIELPDKRLLQARAILIKGERGKREESDKLVVYWVVMEGKHIHDIWTIKINQMLAGLINKAREGIIVRIDFRNLNKEINGNYNEEIETVREFLTDFYLGLPATTKNLLFGY